MAHPFPFFQLPVDVQHRIFDFVGADHTIRISFGKEDTTDRIGDGLPPVSREFNALARPHLLRAAAWRFRSYTAAYNLVRRPDPNCVRHIKELVINVRKMKISIATRKVKIDNATRLLKLLSVHRDFAPRCITLESCKPQDFGVTPGSESEGWLTGLAANGLTTLAAFAGPLPAELQLTNCRGHSTNGIAGSALVLALRTIKSLRNVRVEISPCEVCTAGGVEGDCEFHLLARKVEQVVLLDRVGVEIQPGQTRSLQNNLQAIEEESQPLIQQMAWKAEAKAIGNDVGEVDFFDFDLSDDEEEESGVTQNDSTEEDESNESEVIGTDLGDEFYDFVFNNEEEDNK